jgi:hypothetical protein
MRRFQKWIVEARGDSLPWAATTRTSIPAIATRCESSDVSDLLDALDDLAREKAKLPDWDGDSYDDIARAQELFASIIAALPALLRTLALQGLEARDEETRSWVRLALKEHEGSTRNGE